MTQPKTNQAPDDCDILIVDLSSICHHYASGGFMPLSKYLSIEELLQTLCLNGSSSTHADVWSLLDSQLNVDTNEEILIELDRGINRFHNMLIDQCLSLFSEKSYSFYVFERLVNFTGFIKGYPDD